MPIAGPEKIERGKSQLVWLFPRFCCALLAAAGEDIEIVGLFHLGQMLDQGDKLRAGRAQLSQILGSGVSAELGEVDIDVVHLRVV